MMEMSETLEQGINPMSIFGEEFDEGSYCWLVEDGTLILTVIIVKKIYRNSGVLTKLLEDVKKYAKRVEIPTPSEIVYKKAIASGYKYEEKWDDLYGDTVQLMVWSEADE